MNWTQGTDPGSSYRPVGQDGSAGDLFMRHPIAAPLTILLAGAILIVLGMYEGGAAGLIAGIGVILAIVGAVSLLFGAWTVSKRHRHARPPTS